MVPRFIQELDRLKTDHLVVIGHEEDNYAGHLEEGNFQYCVEVEAQLEGATPLQAFGFCFPFPSIPHGLTACFKQAL
jgi:hypothetical protein